MKREKGKVNKVKNNFVLPATPKGSARTPLRPIVTSGSGAISRPPFRISEIEAWIQDRNGGGEVETDGLFMNMTNNRWDEVIIIIYQVVEELRLRWPVELTINTDRDRKSSEN